MTAAAILASLALLAALSLAATPSLRAQIAGARPVGPQDAWNPRPDDGDFTIPLPCGLSMAFRPIFIPEKGYLGELEGHFGTELQSDTDQTQSLSRRHRVYLGSPLSIENLPESYRPKAQAMKAELSPDQDPRQLYLIGKYEVTVAQWDAVVQDGCPFDPATAALPKTGVSWYQAQAFTARLMTWILQNAPEALPSFADDDRMVGVLRLPTQDEWEYAARGGHQVPRDTMDGMDIFPMGPGEDASDYGVYDDGVNPPESGPVRIGLRKPNPAGLHDTVGNAAEMTMEAYKITVGDRLHGSAGGFVQKGGSFRSGYHNVVPGARMELPFFYRAGPTQTSEMGVRLVLSSVNGGSIRRINEISAELERAGATDTTLVADDPLKTVDALLGEAETEAERQALRSLRSSLESYNAVVNERRREAVRSHVWGLLYTMLSLRSNSTRMIVAHAQRQTEINFVKQIDDALKGGGATAAERKALARRREERVERRDSHQRFIEDAESSFVLMRAHYESLLLDARSFPRDMVLDQLDYVRQDIRGEDYLHRELRACDELVDRHVRAVLDGGSPSRIPRADLEIQSVPVKPPRPDV
ncbi:MAG: formylglycine-generating enzyme family protein [Deltaproteobacteria bacterium]|nr:formylglycine-generating enzyme family protein [Deltaproteobacteria bacterium]